MIGFDGISLLGGITFGLRSGSELFLSDPELPSALTRIKKYIFKIKRENLIRPKMKVGALEHDSTHCVG